MNLAILVVSEMWWPEGTGGILASFLVSRILRDAGFKLTIIHGTKNPKIIKGVNYIFSDLLNVRNKHKLWANCLILTKQSFFLKAVENCDIVYVPRYCYPLIPSVKKLGKKVIVHLHDYLPISYNAVIFDHGKRGNLYPSTENIKFEIFEHGDVLRALGTLAAPINMLCRLWLRYADVIICVSRRHAEIISNVIPELSHKIKVVYNPLPKVPHIKKKSTGKTFLYLGGDSYIKGFYTFIKASREVLIRDPSVTFIIAGNLRNINKKFLSNMKTKINGSYKVLGYLPHNEVLRLHQMSHALIFPSICEEPSPYSIVESMLAGTLPIASKIGGIPEIVNGTFAEKMLYEPRNVEELVNKIRIAISLSNNQLMEIGRRLRESTLKRFNINAIKRQLLNIFYT